MSKGLRAYLVWLILPCLAISAAAQGQPSSLNGRVTDTSGAVVPTAEVSLVPVVAPMPGMTMPAPTPLPGRMSNDGAFAFTQIPAGEYVLQVDAPGYSRSSQQVT